MGLSLGVCSLEEFDDLYSIYNNALISKNEIYGVEAKEQVDFLIKHDCNIAQRYYFSKPLDKLSYFELLKKR